ncbi:hypothetical protein [Belnapia rosea]|uniref:hypothetical protein n=1 Tax=Belnapia rosea TaxID=938405 RepID=UPI00088BA0B1|nr:hypothetical protein [Belnapia rosea]SDB68223.1 hypothetical protein SAMN02927895_03160 [Belnapia rosea]
MAPAEDDTVRLKLPGEGPARRGLIGGLALLALLGLLGGGVWYGAGGPGEDARPAPAATPAPPQPMVRVVAEAELLALLPEQPSLYRLRENPQVFVLLFPDLARQGEALNRAAALIEKAGLPRDRLLDATELAAAIARSGDTPATWYLGHDYRSADLARFFALAERDRVALNEAELWLRDQFALAAAAAGPGPFAMVSAAAPGPQMDMPMRMAVLRHEIGHGHYFTLPGLAGHVQAVWRNGFTEAERGAFRGFLGREGYDAGNEELMANEAMAYLLFTPDPRLFGPAQVGLAPATLVRLRELLRVGLTLP